MKVVWQFFSGADFHSGTIRVCLDCSKLLLCCLDGASETHQVDSFFVGGWMWCFSQINSVFQFLAGGTTASLFDFTKGKNCKYMWLNIRTHLWGTHFAILSVQDMATKGLRADTPSRFWLALRAVTGSVPSPPFTFTRRWQWNLLLGSDRGGIGLDETFKLNSCFHSRNLIS